MTLAVSGYNILLDNNVKYDASLLSLTVIGRSNLSQVIYLRLNSRIVKPPSSSPETNIQSCCSSTGGENRPSAYLSCDTANKITIYSPKG